MHMTEESDYKEGFSPHHKLFILWKIYAHILCKQLTGEMSDCQLWSSFSQKMKNWKYVS